MPWIRKNGKRVWVSPPTDDRDPLNACDVEYVEVGGTRLGRVLSSMAFDASYGPETQAQIDWHVANRTPGADKWEVGKPVPGFRSSTRSAA